MPKRVYGQGIEVLREGDTLGAGVKDSAEQDGDDSRRRAHPSMQWWYDVSKRTPEGVEEARRITELRDRVGYQRPRGESAPLHLQKWNFGVVAIAVAVTVLVAVAGCVLVYLLRAQDGLLGSAGSLLTLPPWWMEAALYLGVGGLAAEQVANLRYRKRYRQLVSHSRGKDN